MPGLDELPVYGIIIILPYVYRACSVYLYVDDSYNANWSTYVVICRARRASGTLAAAGNIIIIIIIIIIYYNIL